jgi:hypothetical protein
VLALAVCNHIAQETGSHDHKEYGTVHAVIYIQAWGRDKALMELTEILHPTTAPLMLQLPGQIKIKKYEMTNKKS